MRQRILGRSGQAVSAIGLGCMGMSFAYGAADEKESIGTLHRALELGVNFWDTADMYANGANEELISRVLRPNRDKIFIATKFGFRFRDGVASHSGSGNTYFDGSPKWVRQAAEISLKRLGIETIDLYYAHRVDPDVPVEETVGAMADLVAEGKVRFLGLSEASAASIRKANAIHPISALQSEYNLITRGIEGEIMQTARELGIAIVPFSPMARGLFDNIGNVADLAQEDFRRSLPRYQGEALLNNQMLAAELSELAESKDITASQLALAWVLSRGEDIIPIPGTKRVQYLEQNVAAADVRLTSGEMEQIEAILKKHPHTGARYSEGAMRLVNN